MNQERVRLMTRLAAYEQDKGKDYMKMDQYFRKDYLALHMIKTFLCSTLAFAVLFLLSVCYRMEDWFQELYQGDYTGYLVKLVAEYVLFVLFYQIVAWIVYSLRYKKGHKLQRQYHSQLKKLEKIYEKEEKQI